LTLESLVPGTVVEGLLSEPVVVERVERAGRSAVTIHYRDERGQPGSQLRFIDELADLEITSSADRGSLDADPRRFLEAFDAYRVRHAHLFDPMLAVNSSNIEPLPHQMRAVYGSMLVRRPLRFLLADDPGAGKTIMAGLYIRELMARYQARRCLVAAPGSLVEQWREELRTRFGLRFAIFDRSMLEGGGNPFNSERLLIVRVDQIARNRDLLELLDESRWDLSIVDEAHKLTARYWGHDVRRSKRYGLGERLARISANFLLMTATPHSGKEDEFQLFMRLLDEDRFVGRAVDHGGGHHARDLMRRLVKEQLRHLDGRPLFPERRATTLHYRLRPQEMELYEHVSTYVREGMNKVAGDERRRTVGFALLVLQRRLASSPEAILRSLERRRDRLQAELERVRANENSLADVLRASLEAEPPEDDEDLPAAELETLESELSEASTSARTPAELELEIEELRGLVVRAGAVREAGIDQKWEQLSRLMDSLAIRDEDGLRRKLIIFTEHRDTLNYLEGRLVAQLGSDRAIVCIHGGLSQGLRREAQRAFRDDPEVSVLLATDAAGEGFNLQCAHLMVNYDLPWNPNRLEQRFGRIHRIGQSKVCHLWNLVAEDTREGDVFSTLLTKLENQRASLGDCVFDVLGEVLTGQDLARLLRDAIQTEDRSGQQRKAEQLLKSKVGRELDEALEARARTVGELTDEEVAQTRLRLVAARAGSLQPRVVERFVRRAAIETRCELIEQGSGLFRAGRVSAEVREASEEDQGVRSRYDGVAFEAGTVAQADDEVELLTPGHPFVDGLAVATGKRLDGLLERGTVLEDPRSEGDYALVLLRYELSEQGGVSEETVTCLRVSPDGAVRVVSPSAFTAVLVPEGDVRVSPEVVQSAIENAIEYISSKLLPARVAALEAELRDRRSQDHRGVLQRLDSEIARLRSREAALRSESPEDAEELVRRIESLESRRESRAQEVQASVRVSGTRPELVGVVGVQGTAPAGTEARIEGAKRSVADLLGGRGHVEEPPQMSGYDLLWAPDDPDQDPRLISLKLDEEGDSGRLSEADALVRSNSGELHSGVQVDSGGRVSWT